MPILDSVFSRVFRPVIADVDWIPNSLFAQGEPGAWYDPSDLTTLFQDSAGATPVTATGQTVGRILDKSGRGNHATRATLAQCPTYQIDSTGRPYLSFDGVDDSLVTGTITPAIDKVQVFSGVRKISDAARANIVEFGNAALNAWFINGPSGSGSDYYFGSAGSVSTFTRTVKAAPTTDVLTCIGDIANDIAIIRDNGTQVATSTANQGTGNYNALPLYIGRRGGTTLPFNGRIYSLIVRFGSSLSSDQITSAEAWVNGKTGAY